MSRRFSPLRFRHASTLLIAPLLLGSCLLSLRSAIPQSAQPRAGLHGVVSRLELRPPLRSASLSVRYSPDGLYLMIQDPSGIFIFTRNPLRPSVFFAADNTYAAEFSADSKTVTSVGAGLRITRANLPRGEPHEEKDLPTHDGCLQGLLSPGGSSFACLAPDLQLVVYDLATLRPVFSKSLEVLTSRPPIVLVPLNTDTAFSSPLGYRWSNNWDGMIGKDVKYASMSFSSDGKRLFVFHSSDSFCADLASGQKCSLPGPLKKHKFAVFHAFPDDRALLSGGEMDATPAILSLKDGAELASLSFTAESARLASNPRYALLSDVSATGHRVFDLQQNREMETPLNLGMDVFGDEMAAVDEQGDLFLYRVGERLPFLSSSVPLDNIRLLRAATVTPNLDRIAFSVDGSGGVFSLSTGQRLYFGPRFSGATFSDSYSAYLLFPPGRKVVPQILRVDLASSKAAPVWSGGKDVFRYGGAALLEYSFESPMGRGIPLVRLDESDVPYRLRGLDLDTGKELWKRDFPRNSPVAFSDPQGERLVLAWNAQSQEAQDAAKRAGPAAQIYKHAKLAKQDSFFEVLDARSAKTVGGVLVQEGNSAYSFDAAFSVGNALFLFKDGKRLFVYSLLSGNQVTKLVGGMPAVSAESELFAIEEKPRVLSIYDLATGTKLDQQVFPESLAYIHFSADGKRLLALTVYQMAYVLDVSSIRSAAKTASSPPEKQ